MRGLARDRGLLARIQTALTRLARATEHISAALIGLVVICNAAQIFWRYVLVDPLGFTDEAMRYSMVWVTFLAGSALVFRREHMATTLLDHPRLGVLRRAVRAVVLIAIAGYAVFFTWNGLPLAFRNASQLSPSAQIPMIYPYIAVPFGGALVAIYAVFLLILPPTPLEDEFDGDMVA